MSLIITTIIELSKSFDGRRQPRFIRGKETSNWQGKPVYTLPDEVIQRATTMQEVQTFLHASKKWSTRHRRLPDVKLNECLETELKSETLTDCYARAKMLWETKRKVSNTCKNGTQETQTENSSEDDAADGKHILDTGHHRRDQLKSRHSQDVDKIVLREMYIESGNCVPEWFIILFQNGSRIVNFHLEPVFMAKVANANPDVEQEVNDLFNTQLQISVAFYPVGNSEDVDDQKCFITEFKDYPSEDCRQNKEPCIPRWKNELCGWSTCFEWSSRRIAITGKHENDEGDEPVDVEYKITLLNEGPMDEPECIKGTYRRQMLSGDDFLTWKIVH